jgi:hypothetical protein
MKRVARAVVPLLSVFLLGAGVMYACQQYLDRPPESYAAQLSPVKVRDRQVPALPDPLPAPATPVAAVPEIVEPEPDLPVVDLYDPDTFLYGVFDPTAPYRTFAEIEALEEETGPFDTIMYFADFSEPLALQGIERVASTGRFPLVTWEPWRFGQGKHQAEFTLASFLAGDHDTVIDESAERIASFGGPVMIRFAHEMNGDWYPWNESVNTNEPGEFVAVWRYVHDRFQAAGATNAVWVWSPNVTTYLPTPLERFWPGDDYVDVVGLSGYLRAGQSFEERFRPTLTELRTLTDAPVIIAETSVQHPKSDDVSRPLTMCRLVADALADPDIRGVVFFNHDSTANWRLGRSAPSVADGRDGSCDDEY